MVGDGTREAHWTSLPEPVRFGFARFWFGVDSFEGVCAALAVLQDERDSQRINSGNHTKSLLTGNIIRNIQVDIKRRPQTGSHIRFPSFAFGSQLAGASVQHRCGCLWVELQGQF